MPDRLTTPEGIDRLGDEIAAKVLKLRMSTDKGQGNGNGGPSSAPSATKVQIIAVVAAILSPFITMGGGGYFMTAYWRGQDATDRRFETIEREQAVSKKERAELLADIARIDRERASRIADLDQWRVNVESELRQYRIAFAEYQQTKAVVSELGKKLVDGRDERLRDRESDRNNAQQARDAIMSAVGDLKTEVALLRQSMEARRRDQGGPFGESQRWGDLPPWSPPFPHILRTIYSPREDPAAILVAN